MKVCPEHRKTHDFINKKPHLTEKVLWHYKPNYQQKLEHGEKKIKKFCRHDQTEVVIFGQSKNMLHSATVMQFPFGQPSHKSFCRNVGLCWGPWPCLPLISSGWVVVGDWLKVTRWVEGPSSEVFPSICSSKLEASHACLQRLQLFLKMGFMVSTLFIFHVSRSDSGVVNSLGTYFSTWYMCVWMQVYVHAY